MTFGNYLDDNDLRVIVLRAFQRPVFSAGHDLREVTQERGPQSHQQVFTKCETLMKLLQDIPIPVIAQVILVRYTHMYVCKLLILRGGVYVILKNIQNEI